SAASNSKDVPKVIHGCRRASLGIDVPEEQHPVLLGSATASKTVTIPPLEGIATIEPKRWVRLRCLGPFVLLVVDQRTVAFRRIVPNPGRPELTESFDLSNADLLARLKALGGIRRCNVAVA